MHSMLELGRTCCYSRFAGFIAPHRAGPPRPRLRGDRSARVVNRANFLKRQVIVQGCVCRGPEVCRMPDSFGARLRERREQQQVALRTDCRADQDQGRRCSKPWRGTTCRTGHPAFFAVRSSVRTRTRSAWSPMRRFESFWISIPIRSKWSVRSSRRPTPMVDVAMARRRVSGFWSRQR